MANCRYPHDIVFACFLRNNVRLRNNVCIFLLIKIMLKNDFGLRWKSFGGSVKDRYFSISYNDWRNMFININKKNCLLIFFEMFLKHVKMGWQFQGTLKLSVYLIHFKIFFQELEAFQTSYLSIINYLQPFVYIFQFLISVSFISVNATMNCNISNMAPVIVFHY